MFSKRERKLTQVILPQQTSGVYLEESASQYVGYFVIKLALISCQTISVEFLLFC